MPIRMTNSSESHEDMESFVHSSALVYAPSAIMPAVPRFICPIMPVTKFRPISTMMLMMIWSARIIR